MYVLLPDNIHVPLPVFVSAPVVPNPIILATVFPEVDVPPKVKVKPVPLIVPELLNVIPPLLEIIVELLPKASNPL